MKIDYDLNVGRSDSFAAMYFNLHNHISEQGYVDDSRNGECYEIMNFKTILDKPDMRCVGGYHRNANVFFLIAESLWIWAGRNDVRFLDIFNSQLKQYSDDGEKYHGAYGYRLRKQQLNELYVRDQLLGVLQMLETSPESRRAVASIWNPELDLGIESNDIPCNDMLMFKIRDGKLCQTIQNRSNDLNLGLTTNVFQFSVIGEFMANILGVELGQQVHNSQSLHVYKNKMSTDIKRLSDGGEPYFNLYDHCNPLNMDCNFGDESGVEERMHTLDFWVKGMITSINNMFYDRGTIDQTVNKGLAEFSPTLHLFYQLMELYVNYKLKRVSRVDALASIYAISVGGGDDWVHCDYVALANNFFAARLSEEEWRILTENNNASEFFGEL